MPQNKSKVISNFLRSLDRFGHPITLTYRKSPTFKSVLGGVMTILVFAALSAYWSYLFRQCILRE